MEALNHSYGFTLYVHTATATISGTVIPGDRARDRVLVYVNNTRRGVIDSQYQHPLNVSVTLNPGDKLQLLVENLGRVDYYSRGNYYRNYVQDPYKGILGDVLVGGQVVKDWDMYPLQLDSIPSPSPSGSANLPAVQSGVPPLFYHGTFTVPSNTTEPMEQDTYLALPNAVKGNVWVNGFNLGRYWYVGPQQSLYLPGTLVKAGGVANDVVVLDLEPGVGNSTKGMVAEGLAERAWWNTLDLDRLGCV